MYGIMQWIGVMVAQAPVPTGTSGASEAPETGGMSLIEFIAAGGAIGMIILVLSMVALALGVLHLLQIRASALAPEPIVEQLDQSLRAGRVDDALAFSMDPTNACFLTHVVGSGLSRYKRSPFGALELKGALEEAGRDQVARLYRSTDAMALVAGVAPMLGLLGTVVGINGAFATMSSSQGFATPDQLAGDISLALVTTIMGLTLAIPTMAAVAFFRNRIDSIASDIGVIVDDLALHIEQGAGGGGGTPGGSGGQVRPGAGGASA